MRTNIYLPKGPAHSCTRPSREPLSFFFLGFFLPLCSDFGHALPCPPPSLVSSVGFETLAPDLSCTVLSIYRVKSRQVCTYLIYFGLLGQEWQANPSPSLACPCRAVLTHFISGFWIRTGTHIFESFFSTSSPQK